LKALPLILVLYRKVEFFRDEIDSFSNVLDRFGVEAVFYAHNFAPNVWPMVVDDTSETEAAFNLIPQLVFKNTT